eukprot:gene5856-8079_t
MPSVETILFVAGGVSGMMEAIVVQPFDMVKTRHQLNSATNESVYKTLCSIYKEGGFLRLYRGMAAEVVGIVPKSSGMYATYEIVRKRLAQSNDFGDTSFTAALAGFCSGIPEALIVQPTQIVKVRVQAKEHIGQYKNSLDCLIKLVTKEGLSSLLIGLEATLFRNCVWNTVYFGTMHYVKRLLPKTESKAISLLQTLISGSCGAVFATCFNAPFDVAKSRFQSQLPLAVSGLDRLKYRNTFQTLYLISHEEGISACYKGFYPKAIRMCLGGGVAMATFELVQEILLPNQ